MIRDLLSSLVSWEALALYALSIAGAVAWFVPPFRRMAIAVGFFVAGLLVIYSKGKRDGVRKEKERWLEEERQARSRALDARRRAERDAPRVHDPRDRDDN